MAQVAPTKEPVMPTRRQVNPDKMEAFKDLKLGEVFPDLRWYSYSTQPDANAHIQSQCFEMDCGNFQFEVESTPIVSARFSVTMSNFNMGGGCVSLTYTKPTLVECAIQLLGDTAASDKPAPCTPKESAAAKHFIALQLSQYLMRFAADTGANNKYRAED